ncbi:putative membrane protein [Hoeflea marina]|uniref:Putative membrane protein n=1 Tax=Hoeflea marina TaxID=274592 RepID=A0A317PFH0_9HYPH|nr:DUF2339 domain-containing protein [Hoeflea marina]PWV98774.1 putative membrane protein [Hoeflea marina]
MDGFFLLVGVAFLLVWVTKVSRRADALERRMTAMSHELAVLRGGAPPSEQGTVSPVVTDIPDRSEPAEATASAPEFAAADEPAPLPAEPAVSLPKPKRDLESLIGGSWSVILGGITVALGALFLVRYSIEAGLLGPRARTASGVLLSVALLAAGEWLRRKDRREHLAPFMSADIPGILTGAGAVAAFGTLYAAHALYGFIGPATAFIALTLTGIACLALASIHGPKLAAIGLLGAFGAPLLVDSSDPNPVALTLHTLVVTASVLATARIRDWRWLAIGGIVGSIVWAVLGVFNSGPTAELMGAVLLIGLALIYVAAFGWAGGDRPQPAADRPADRTGVAAFIALAATFALYCADRTGGADIATALVLGLVYAATAANWPQLARIAPWTGLIVAAMGLGLSVDLVNEPGLINGEAEALRLVPADVVGFVRQLAMVAMPVALAALALGWRMATTAPRTTGQLAIGASLVAVLALLVAYLRISPFETSLATGMVALALAAGFVALTERFTRARPDDWTAPAPAAFAVAAIALMALGMGVMLTKMWLPFGLALTSAGVAWVHRDRPLVALPWLAVALAALSASGLWFNSPFPAETIGATPFLNRLVLIAGLPAAALLAGGEWLRRARAQFTSSLQTSIGLALLALFVALELRHFITGGEIASPFFGLADMAAQSIAALGFSIGLQRVAQRSGAKIFDYAALAAGVISLLMLVVGLGIAFNPLFTGDGLGEGRIFNMLLPAYLVTGLLAGLVAWLARGVRPAWYRIGYGLAAGLLLFLYATLMTRHGFQGPAVGLMRTTSDIEFWTYSAVWLALGGLLLAAGLAFRSLPLRMASAALIGLTICKVFLLDMSSLTGALRAFSFIGLGLALLLIGRLYQRILVRTGNGGDPASDPAAETGGGPAGQPEPQS